MEHTWKFERAVEGLSEISSNVQITFLVALSVQREFLFLGCNWYWLKALVEVADRANPTIGKVKEFLDLMGADFDDRNELLNGIPGMAITTYDHQKSR